MKRLRDQPEQRQPPHIFAPIKPAAPDMAGQHIAKQRINAPSQQQQRGDVVMTQHRIDMIPHHQRHGGQLDRIKRGGAVGKSGQGFVIKHIISPSPCGRGIVRSYQKPLKKRIRIHIHLHPHAAGNCHRRQPRGDNRLYGKPSRGFHQQAAAVAATQHGERGGRRAQGNDAGLARRFAGLSSGRF